MSLVEKALKKIQAGNRLQPRPLTAEQIVVGRLPLAAVTDNIRYEEKTTVAVLSDPMIVVGN